MNKAAKKPPIMMKVQKVRVMKLAFFFSYSDSSCSSGVWGFCSSIAIVSRRNQPVCHWPTHLLNIANGLAGRPLLADIARARPATLEVAV